MYYTTHWEKLPFVPFQNRKRKSDNRNFLHVRITCLNNRGKICSFEKKYEDWIAVCTNNISKVKREIYQFFPTVEIRCEQLSDQNYKKVLPYFEKRLTTGKLSYQPKPIYKVFLSSICIEDFGTFFNHKNKIALYERDDWLVKIYLDFCTRYDTQSFYYKWYDIYTNSPFLLDSFHMRNDILDLPNWKMAAFDLETVPVDGEDRLPNGTDPTDQIVMISIVKWTQHEESKPKEYVLYLNPCQESLSLPVDSKIYFQYVSEVKMLNDFHTLIQDCHVLTGYNINNFDIPCVFKRLVWLRMYPILAQYSSRKVGDQLVTTFQNKLVIDMYHYIRIFSSYDLPGLKLDDVVKVKLGLQEGKLPVKSIGIHSWYMSENRSKVTPCLATSASQVECHACLQPRNVPVNQFGTFINYLQYCLRDSQLVHQLFCKEIALSFLIERANFTILDAVEALHFGNSRFLLDLLKTYGTVLGYFFNSRLLKNLTDGDKYTSVFVGKNQSTYQGALNYCIPTQYYEDVSVLDFTSMYPCSLLSANLCYGTCTIMTREEYFQQLTDDQRHQLVAIPYRIHGDTDFQAIDPEMFNPRTGLFRYPPVNPEKDAFIIVINQQTEAFLPSIVKHFLVLRKEHQKQWKSTRNVIHYNAQLCIKILINSLYGIMASKDSPLAYLPIAMSIVTLARYQLLGSYYYMMQQGYNVCYADTDSLMVQKWPYDHCDSVNQFLNLPHVEIKFEQRMKRLLVLSKKRYVYEKQNGTVETKGFQKKINDLIKYMSDAILEAILSVYRSGNERGSPSDGWILLVDILTEAYYRCRDVKKYSIIRKTKSLDSYKSTSCATVRMLQRYPERAGEYIEYTYGRADVAAANSSKWIMDVDECRYVDFEKLFISQKKIFTTLLNIVYWQMDKPEECVNMILNTMRWKTFVHAELLYYLKNENRCIAQLVEKGVRYTFQINDHLTKRNGRRSRLVRQ